MSNRCDCKLRCSGAGADNDRSGVVHFVKDAVGDGFAFGFAWEVVGVDLIGLAAVARTGVLEIANKLSFFSVHTDHRLIVSDKQSFDPLNQAILIIALRVRVSDQALDIGLERKTQRSEKLGHRGGGDRT